MSRPYRLLAMSALLSACSGGGLPVGLGATPRGDGPRIVWDLEAEPLPEIPLPNDVATWPDPTSPTGRRLNASLIAPSGMERRLRQEFDRLDGFGTFGPLSVSFTEPLDTDDLIARQGRGHFSEADFQRHAIYLIDLETGVPVPLDINSERFPRAVAGPSNYYGNDPHAGESNLLFETVEEDVNGNGALDAGEDLDYDGVLDVPNTLDGQLLGTPFETIDRMLWFYERETNTLFVRPLLPLMPTHQYAVVLTDRLRGEDGNPVRSPFDQIHPLSQMEDLHTLPAIFNDKQHIYGDLAFRGWEGVAFAWTFTTQSTDGDLVALREGLYGRGNFAHLAEDFPPELVLAPLRGGVTCTPDAAIYTATPEELGAALENLPVDGLGFPVEQIDALLASLVETVSHFAFGYFESPYLLGDPDAETPQDTFQMDRMTGDARIDRDLVPMFIIVPKETEQFHQPFRTTLYAHGYGSLNVEAIAFAGEVARQGVATVSIDAQGHGLPLDNSLRSLLEAVLSQACLSPLGRALAVDRARDLNDDDTADSAGLFFSAYMFHTRDTLRQSVVDWMQAMRIMRSWEGHPDYPEGRLWQQSEISPDSGRPIVFSGDVNGDGTLDRAGDFDGNGVIDIGGYDASYAQWGSSLGGMISMLNMGVEPAIDTAAPVSGGGSLFDVGLRTSLGTARHPIWLRVMGPLITSSVSEGPSADTACAVGDRSIRFELPDLNERVTTEIACVSEGVLSGGDVVVLRNHRNGEVRCAGVEENGLFRVAVPTDENDRLSMLVYDDALDRFDFGTCRFAGEEPTINDRIESWRSANGTEGGGMCAHCARYRERIFDVTSPLIAPIEGLGLGRQSPDLRRIASLAQIALDPGDPINYARRVFLDPVTAQDVPARTRSIMVISTVGDTTVPPATANAYARAAGVLAFMPPDAPEEFADWRAPARFETIYGAETPDDVLIDHHTLEGLARLQRHPVPGGPEFLFDVDDLSEGQQYFAPNGRSQLAEADGGLRPNRLPVPLRWGRESRVAAAAGFDPWRTAGDFPGYSLVLNVMTIPTGQHVLLPIDPSKVFDESSYMLNVIGWYLGSHGREVAWNVLPDPFCLEARTCVRTSTP